MAPGNTSEFVGVWWRYARRIWLATPRSNCKMQDAYADQITSTNGYGFKNLSNRDAGSSVSYIQGQGMPTYKHSRWRCQVQPRSLKQISKRHPPLSGKIALLEKAPYENIIQHRVQKAPDQNLIFGNAITHPSCHTQQSNTILVLLSVIRQVLTSW